MPRRKPVTDEQLQGLKYFKKFLPLLDRLHDAATVRDTAGNRVLHFDQYIALQRVFFFNPIVTSMRGLVQASALKGNQKGIFYFIGDQKGTFYFIGEAKDVRNL